MKNFKSLKSMIDFFNNEANQREIFECFITNEVAQKFRADRYTKLRSKQMLITEDDMEPQEIELAFVNSDKFTKEQRSYLHLVYWSVALSEGNNGKAEVYMKKFIYFFIMDLGISPFVKCFDGKNLLEACIKSRRFDTLKELLSHTYICCTPEECLELDNSSRDKDIHGNNLLHNVF
jgi:hypothetical protein